MRSVHFEILHARAVLVAAAEIARQVEEADGHEELTVAVKRLHGARRGVIRRAEEQVEPDRKASQRRQRRKDRQLAQERHAVQTGACEHEKEHRARAHEDHLPGDVVDRLRQVWRQRIVDVDDDKKQERRIVQRLQPLQADEQRHQQVDAQQHLQIPEMVRSADPAGKHLRRRQQRPAAGCAHRLVGEHIDQRPDCVELYNVGKLLLEVESVALAQEQRPRDHHEHRQRKAHRD